MDLRELSERSAIELQTWVTDKLFSRAEVKLIAKKRNQFEYVISSTSAEIVDFLRYIKFEMNLETLLQVRLKKKMFQRHNYRNISKVIRIYRKALHKFKNLNLYILFIKFCVQNQLHNTIKQVFEQGIRDFPTLPDIWNHAAQFEYDVNHNILAARVLLQMALRYNKFSQKVWIQFFTLEMKYWHKMTKRELKDKAKALKPKTENSVNIPQLESSDIVPEFSAEGDPSLSSSSSSTSSPFFECAIPKLIYKQATAAIPEFYEFRAKFLEVARKFTRSEPLIDFISADITEKFALHEQALASHADLQFRLLGKFSTVAYESACKVYEHAIKHSKSEVVWSYYVKYLLDKLHNLDFESIDLVQFVTNKILDVCEKAPISIEIYSQWIQVLLATADSEKADKITNRAIKKFPKSASLRLLKIEFLIKSGKPKQKILKAFETAVKKSEASADLWSRYIQWLTMNETFDSSNILKADDMEDELDTKHADEAVVELASRCLKSVYAVLKPDEFNLLKVNLLNTIFFHFGVVPTRKFLNKALQSAPTTLAFCEHALALEEAQPMTIVAQPQSQPQSQSQSHLQSNSHSQSQSQSKEGFSAETVRKIYEEAVRSYGSTAEDMWLRYIQFEQRQLQVNRVGDLYFRAKRTLKDFASFMAKYELIKQN